jgi:ATP-dependent DNA helicase RecG
MTPEMLLELIGAGESMDVEFKGEEKEPLSDGDLVEAAMCLADRPGTGPGWLVVGVEKDGRITGARPRHEAGITDPFRVQAHLANHTQPPLSTRVELLSLQGEDVLVIEIPPSRMPVGSTKGKYVRRAIGGDGKPACLPFHFHEMQAAQADRGILDYSALAVSDAKWDDLDPLEFERFRRFIRESKGLGDATLVDLPDLELAKALGVVEANREVRAVRMGGLLLFGRTDALNRLIPTHEVAFQVLSGQRVAVNEFFRYPVPRTMDEIMSHFRARYREEELMVGLLRVGVPDYSEPAFREGLANALIHRDYSRLGAVHVQWHDDRIEISNPGGFPEGVSLNNLLVTAPRPRNPRLAHAFKRAGVVERTARGIDTIFYAQLRNGRPAPSYQRSTQTDVVLVLPGGAASLDFVKLVVEEGQAGRPLGLDALLSLNALRQQRQIDTTDAAGLLQKPEADARATLSRLVETGLVESRGARKGRLYHLSAATYRRLGERAAYVRQRGFEPIQQEQMVLQFVEKHGRITRAEASELCRIASLQARDLLKRLRDKGLIVLKGTRRGAHYELPAKDMDPSKSGMDKSIKSKTARPKRRSVAGAHKPKSSTRSKRTKQK